MQKLNVLFLCTGNSCRSVMGETLLRHIAGDRFNAYSAGTDPKGIHPLAEQVLNEIGVSTEGVRSKHVSEYLGKVTFHHVIIVCDSAMPLAEPAARGHFVPKGHGAPAQGRATKAPAEERRPGFWT